MPGSIIAGIASGLVNNALSQENAQEQRDWQERMFHLQNKYNHPAAMADRMREAGLNPYTMTGAEPAASVGTGATAQTFPLQNPFESLLLASQIQKTNAETGLLGGQTQKVNADWLNGMAQLALAGQQYQLGLISIEEYRAKVDKYLEWLENNNPFQIEGDNTIADTDLKKEQKETEEEQQKYLQALTTTENELRSLTKDQIQQNIDESKALVSKLDAEAKKLVRETEHIENLIEREDIVNAANAFYGITIDTLPATLQFRLMENWQMVVRGEIFEETALRVAANAVERYRTKELHIPRTRQYNASESLGVGAFGVKADAGKSAGWTESY